MAHFGPHKPRARLTPCANCCATAVHQKKDDTWAKDLTTPPRSRFQNVCDILTLSMHSAKGTSPFEARPAGFQGYKQLFLSTAQEMAATATVTGATLTGLFALAAVDRTVAGSIASGASLLGLTAVAAAATRTTWRLAKAVWQKRTAP